jgi:hypothetical protein
LRRLSLPTPGAVLTRRGLHVIQSFKCAEDLRFREQTHPENPSRERRMSHKSEEMSSTFSEGDHWRERALSGKSLATPEPFHLAGVPNPAVNLASATGSRVYVSAPVVLAAYRQVEDKQENEDRENHANRAGSVTEAAMARGSANPVSK